MLKKVFTLIEEGSLVVDYERPWLHRGKLKWCPSCKESHHVTLTTDMKQFQCFLDKDDHYWSVYTGEISQ